MLEGAVGKPSILVGISANESLKTGKMVNVQDLFPLPEKTNPVIINGAKQTT